MLLRRGSGKYERQSGSYSGDSYLRFDTGDTSDEIVYPKYALRYVEPEVPPRVTKDYQEACGVLGISPKASAALSRRILQDVLREQFSIRGGSLATEIDDFLKLKDVPTYLAEAIDAVRHVGNFAAHPLKDQETGDIIDVEPGEAEWLLEVLDSLFDFAFVQPKRLAAKRDALNSKLAALGKPPMRRPVAGETVASPAAVDRAQDTGAGTA